MFPLPQTMIIKALVGALVIVVAVATGYGWGLRSGMERFNDYVADQAKQAVQIVTRQGEVTERVVTKYIKVRGEQQVVTREIEKEVIKYAETNPGSCIDPGWISLHNRAAAGGLPEPARRAQ